MSKAILIEAVAKYQGGTKKEAELALESVTKAIVEVARGEGSIRIPGFGTFTDKFVAGRAGRNPHTGEAIQIADKRQIKFKEAKGL